MIVVIQGLTTHHRHGVTLCAKLTSMKPTSHSDIPAPMQRIVSGGNAAWDYPASMLDFRALLPPKAAFAARRYAWRSLCHNAVSVCLSVCPSVCLSRSYYIKNSKHSLILFRRLVDPPYQSLCQYSDGDPHRGVSNADGVWFGQCFALFQN